MPSKMMLDLGQLLRGELQVIGGAVDPTQFYGEEGVRLTLDVGDFAGRAHAVRHQYEATWPAATPGGFRSVSHQLPKDYLLLGVGAHMVPADIPSVARLAFGTGGPYWTSFELITGGPVVPSGAHVWALNAPAVLDSTVAGTQAFLTTGIYSVPMPMLLRGGQDAIAFYSEFAAAIVGAVTIYTVGWELDVPGAHFPARG